MRPTPAQTVALRTHLRQCLACRAAVRGLHDASRPLAVVFPATGAVLANGAIEHTGSFFVRVYETVSLSLHERAANSFLRAQAVFDTVTAGKMAVAAASAAAVAGGGFAVEGVVGSGPTDRPAAMLRGDAGARALPVLKKVLAGRTRARSAMRRRAAGRSRGSARRQAAPERAAGADAGHDHDDHDDHDGDRVPPARLGGLRGGLAPGRLGRRGRVRLRGSVT